MLLLCLTAGAFGCGEGTLVPTFTPSPTPIVTPAPSPSPVPVVAVFGGEGDDGFLDGVKAAVETAGLRFAPMAGDGGAAASFTAPGAACGILYLGEGDPVPEGIAGVQMPLFFYITGGQSVPAGMPYMAYDGTGAMEKALAAAMECPPHDTPVRLIGLFARSDGDAHAAWEAAKAEGRVLEKAVYDQQKEKSAPEKWLGETLKRFYPGAVDGVLCETGALAVTAAETLFAAGRSDMEVFSGGTDGRVLEQMENLSHLLVAAYGVDPYGTGHSCGEQAIALLRGPSDAGATLLPTEFRPSGGDS